MDRGFFLPLLRIDCREVRHYNSNAIVVCNFAPTCMHMNGYAGYCELTQQHMNEINDFSMDVLFENIPRTQ